MPAKRKLKCSYREGGRRCPRNGDGNPPVCPAHRIAIAEAARPRRPAEVIAEAMANFLAGKPINREATLGAAEQIFSQWLGGLGADYHPDVMNGETEGAAHRRAQPGRGSWVPRPGTQGAPPPPRPPAGDPRAAAQRARKILGFGPQEEITQEDIDRRRRKLARKYHPDLAGGSEEKMIAVNRAADFLAVAIQHGL